MFNYNKYKKTWDFSISILLTIFVVSLIYYSVISHQYKEDIKKGREAYIISIATRIRNLLNDKPGLEKGKISAALIRIKSYENLQGNEIELRYKDKKGNIVFSTDKEFAKFVCLKVRGFDRYSIDIGVRKLSFINEIRLTVFGVIILLSTLIFLFIRIFFLYREVILFKEDKWSRSIGKIKESIEKVEFSLNKAEETVENLNPRGYKDWIKTYQKISELEILLDKIEKTNRVDLKLKQKKKKLNEQFVNMVQKEYPDWVKKEYPNRPLMSLDVIKEKILNHTKFKEVYLVVLDNLRYDQWLAIKNKCLSIFEKYNYNEELYFSVLPTVTSHARNSLFSGMFPDECADHFYHGTLKNNQYEEQAFHDLLKRNKTKGFYVRQAENEENNFKIKNMFASDAYVKTLIYMFIDGLAHTLSAIKADESAFRKHILVEFNKSVIHDTLSQISKRKAPIIITTDHGSVLVKETVRINQYELKTDFLGKHERVSERFNYGLPRMSNHEDFKVRSSIFISNPKEYHLPTKEKPTYLFAHGEAKFHVEDRKQVHEFVHGGISMEEMIVPVVTFLPR